MPYEIQLPPVEINVRVANTNSAKRYVPTGVYDRKLQLQQEISWPSEPALLPNNELYARMSPAEVVKAWTEAQAKLDWDELAKFVPQQEVQNAKRRAEAAQQSGLAPRQSPATEVIEAVWSAEQSAYFVKCRVVAPVKKWNLAIRNDNTAKRYLFDGGL